MAGCDAAITPSSVSSLPFTGACGCSQGLLSSWPFTTEGAAAGSSPVVSTARRSRAMGASSAATPDAKAATDGVTRGGGAPWAGCGVRGAHDAGRHVLHKVLQPTCASGMRRIISNAQEHV